MATTRELIWLRCKWVCMATFVIGVLAVLAACAAGPGAKADESPETMMPGPDPTLIGSWSRTGDYWEHDDETDDYYIAGVDKIVLTFTNERYIRTHVSVTFDGVQTNDGHDSGGWTATDTTLTRTRSEDHDDDDDTPRIDTNVAKDYYLVGEAGTTLFMHDFGDDEPTTEFVRYERVETTITPSSLLGAWISTEDDDDTTRTRRIVVNADGTVQIVDAATGAEQFEDVITANWTIDAENYYLVLVDPTSSDGEPVMADRIAFAPTPNSPAEIAVSFYWHETKGSDGYRKYGDYWMLFRRDQ